jgi:hypothetical protein
VKHSEQEARKFPACGYGLMGLCCSSCLLGPCRISPFEGKSAKGLCGDNVDLMVAKNLLHLVAGETAGGLKDLSEAVQNLGALAVKQGARKRPGKEALKGILEKYGFTSRVSVNRFAHYLFRESQKLLSPFSGPESPSPLLSSLYPEGAFPCIHRDSLLPDSLTSLIFDALGHEQNESSAVEAILRKCLKTSMIKFISEELRRDINYLTDGGQSSEMENEALDVVENLPPEPLPVVVFLLRDNDLPEAFMSRTPEELRQGLNGIARLIPLKNMSDLPSIGRGFFRKWSLPVNGMGAIAAVFSRSPASVIGALMCGFTVVSFPALPIHGSEVVETYFSKGLKETLGSVYLPPQGGEVVPVILEFLRGKG